MSFLEWGLRLVGPQAWRALEEATRDPRRVQEQLLRNLLAKNRDAQFGRDHRFRDIRSLQDYRAHVPIADYESFRPYVEQIMASNRYALTAEPPLLFTLTSGTTGQPKYIPVTASSTRANARLTRAWLYRALQAHPGYLDGAVLAIVSPEIEGHTEGGIPYGSASGRIYRSRLWLFRRQYAVPYEAFGIKDFDAKYYCLARLALEADVSFVATPNPSSLVRLAEVGDRYRDDIIRDIRKGTILNRLDIDPEVRCRLETRIKPNPARAGALAEALKDHGALRPVDCWPRLRLIGCWKGGAVGTQLEAAKRWYSSEVPRRDLGFLASEAQMSVPISDEGSAGILAITANFYEFIPEGEVDSSSAQTLLCDELEAGKSYYIILTTPGGLYRYDINDVVRVVGFFHATPLIEFVRKGRDMTSIGGEKLHVSQVIAAFERAEQHMGLRCVHYRAVACPEDNRYALLVECPDPQPGSQQLERLLAAVDTYLGEVNIEYRAKRQSHRLGPPCLHLMRPGWFERIYRRRIALGARDSQFKAAILTGTFEEGELEEAGSIVSLPFEP